MSPWSPSTSCTTAIPQPSTGRPRWWSAIAWSRCSPGTTTSGATRAVSSTWPNTSPDVSDPSAMTKATIDDVDVAGRRVLLRVDFNVPLRHGRVGDDRRISAALPTITAVADRGARTTIVTHVGRPHGHVDAALSVVPIADRLI